MSTPMTATIPHKQIRHRNRRDTRRHDKHADYLAKIMRKRNALDRDYNSTPEDWAGNKTRRFFYRFVGRKPYTGPTELPF